jgi:hypothetical protein
MDFFDLRSSTFYYFVCDYVSLCVSYRLTLCLCPCGRHWEPWLLWTDQLDNFRTCKHVVTVVRVPFGNSIEGDSELYLI